MWWADTDPPSLRGKNVETGVFDAGMNICDMTF
jgi:hypothetical protein